MRFIDYLYQFSTELAFDLLATHREKYPTFNDDIQGTAAVSLAGFINAIAESNTPLPEHKIVFFGAGSAAVGIAELVSCFPILECRKADPSTVAESELLVSC